MVISKGIFIDMKKLLLVFILSSSFLSMRHSDHPDTDPDDYWSKKPGICHEIRDELYHRRENLIYARLQMDCYYDKLDGKIEAYDEIIELIELHDDSCLSQ